MGEGGAPAGYSVGHTHVLCHFAYCGLDAHSKRRGTENKECRSYPTPLSMRFLPICVYIYTFSTSKNNSRL